jgi:hypothetical protein
VAVSCDEQALGDWVPCIRHPERRKTWRLSCSDSVSRPQNARTGKAVVAGKPRTTRRSCDATAALAAVSSDSSGVRSRAVSTRSKNAAVPGTTPTPGGNKTSIEPWVSTSTDTDSEALNVPESPVSSSQATREDMESVHTIGPGVGNVNANAPSTVCGRSSRRAGTCCDSALSPPTRVKRECGSKRLNLGKLQDCNSMLRGRPPVSLPR